LRKLKLGDLDKAVQKFAKELADDGRDYVIVDENDKPVLGVVPAWRIANIERNRQELLAMIAQVRENTKDVPPEELEREIEKAIREVREGATD
jgi:hypothetical protein